MEIKQALKGMFKPIPEDPEEKRKLYNKMIEECLMRDDYDGMRHATRALQRLDHADNEPETKPPVKSLGG